MTLRSLALAPFLIPLAALGAPAPVTAPPAPLILETRALRLEIVRAPAPRVARLIDKATGQAIAAGDGSGASLFTIVLGRPDGGQETVESARATISEARVEGSGDPSALTLRYAGFPGIDLAVEARISRVPGDDLLRWHLRVDRLGGRAIRSIQFPHLTAPRTLGDGRDDLLVLPALAGSLIREPSVAWKDGQSVTLRYPGEMSAQFLAYQDRATGLYLAGMDPEAHPMRLVVQRRADGFHLWHEFVPVTDGPSTPGTWSAPYPVAVGATRGAWFDTADLYKRWATAQPWCARRLSEREDIPAWWKRGAAVHVCEVRVYDGKRTCSGSYYPNLAEHLRALRSKIDGPVVPMLAGWENHRRWTAGDYFPVFDAGAAERVLREIRADGFRPFFYLSGLYYTFRNGGRDGGEIPSARDHLDGYVIGAGGGAPKEYRLDESSKSGDWVRHSYQFCPAAPRTRSFFLDIVDRAAALGVDVLQMDQTVGGAGDECHSPSHGHAPGPGRYQTRAFHGLLDAMRARGKERSPEFVLFHEEPHEQLIPHLDGFHVREYYEKRWYRGYPGAVGIPLFSYLYHEYALGYGGDSAGLGKEPSPWNVRCHAMNLVTGRTPGAAIWSSHANVAGAHPDQIAMLRNHSRLLQTDAGAFLLLGRMLHPLALDVPDLGIRAPTQRGGKWVMEEVPTPAILTSSWEAPSGEIGHLFVNLPGATRRLRVALDTRGIPTKATVVSRIHRSTGDGKFAPLWRGATLPRDLEIDMAPLEVAFVELKGN